MSWINAYAFLSVVLVGLIVVLHIYTDLELWAQVALSAAVSTVVLALVYPNVKGFSVGILYFMRSRWRE